MLSAMKVASSGIISNANRSITLSRELPSSSYHEVITAHMLVIKHACISRSKAFLTNWAKNFCSQLSNGSLWCMVHSLMAPYGAWSTS